MFVEILRKSLRGRKAEAIPWIYQLADGIASSLISFASRNDSNMISIKTKQEIEIMRQAGKILAQIMQQIKKQVKPAITTKSLDKLAE